MSPSDSASFYVLHIPANLINQSLCVSTKCSIPELLATQIRPLLSKSGALKFSVTSAANERIVNLDILPG